jgi:hypothetical protein
MAARATPATFARKAPDGRWASRAVGPVGEDPLSAGVVAVALFNPDRP